MKHADTYLPRLLFLAMIPLCALITGCSEEEEITGPTPGPPGSFPGTPEQVMVNFQDAFSSQDLTALQDVIHPDFRFHLTRTDVDRFPLPTDHLNAYEERVAAENMFSGEIVIHPGGAISAAISAIHFDVFQPLASAWNVSPADSLFPGSLRRLYSVDLSIERPGNTTLRIQGQQEFFVASRDSILDDGTTLAFHELVGQRDLSDLSSALTTTTGSWGMAMLTYYTNQAPTAVLAFTQDSESLGNTFVFDASDSFDPDSGLHLAAYRWRFDPAGEFTVWSPEPTRLHSFATPGTKTVQLQVRDRWGLIAAAGETVNVGAVFPDSEDQLIANFLWSLGNLDHTHYADVFHVDYRFKFQSFDVERFELPSAFLDREQELEVAVNTFAPSSGINAIHVEKFDRLENWVDATSHPDFPGTRRGIFEVELLVERPGSTDLSITGLQEFFLARRDSTLPGGQVRPYFAMIGQVDQSNAQKRGWQVVRHLVPELMSWGAFKVLHMPTGP